METENKVIKLFIEDKNSKTIRQISKDIKADYRITHTAVQRLFKKGALFLESVGKSTLCKFNDSYYGIEIYKAESERRGNLLKNKNIKQLSQEILRKVGTSFFVFLIFGSYAKGKQSKSSDMDIMLVSNEKNFEDNVLSVVSLIPLDVHPVVLTEAEFINMKDSKGMNVVKEAVNGAVVIYGVENYYRLKNA